VTDPRPPGGDQDDPLLRAVTEHWAEIEQLADQPQRDRLLGLLAGTAEADPADARAALADELLDLLPPGHPVIRVLRASSMFSRGVRTGAVGPGALGRAAGPASHGPSGPRTLEVTIYLADDRIHVQVEAAVETMLATAGLRIEDRDDPVLGSWFRRMVVGVGDGAQPTASQPAEVTARLLESLAPVLSALQPTKDAVIRAGALLVVKAEWEVSVFQLAPAQQARLALRPDLARCPGEVVAGLGLADSGRPGESTGRAAVLDLYVEEQVLGQDSRFLREAGVSFGQPWVTPISDDELPVPIQDRLGLRQRLTRVVLPFDLEEPPEGCRYLETTVRMAFDSLDVRSLQLSRPTADRAADNHVEDSVLETRGVGRQQLTWKISARSEADGLRATGRQVLAVVESPLAAEWLTGTLDASVHVTRRLLGVVRKSTAEPRHPLRFALNMTDGTFEAD
jgi:hypothetical protein